MLEDICMGFERDTIIFHSLSFHIDTIANNAEYSAKVFIYYIVN